MLKLCAGMATTAYRGIPLTRASNSTCGGFFKKITIIGPTRLSNQRPINIKDITVNGSKDIICVLVEYTGCTIKLNL